MDPADLFPWLFGGGTVLTIVIICCTTVPVVAILGGVGYYIFKMFKKTGDLNQASQSWVQTTGTVINSRVEVSGGETTSVHPRVIYQYEVGGQVYQNDHLRAGDKFMRVSQSSRWAYDTVDRYPIGATVNVYYNPQNPQESALER